jgi:Transmembrane domain of unknown function (DUF3566)
MSDRPQAVRTGVRPEGAARADGAPATGSTPATGQTSVPGGASAAEVPPTGSGPSLTKPATGAVPAQQAPQQQAAKQQAPKQQAPRPADATMPPPSGTAQSVPPAAVAAAAPRAPQQGGQQQGGQQAGRSAKARGNRGPRRARLQLRHIDTWSALKISLILSIALFFIWMVAVGMLYGVLSGLGVFGTLNDLFGQLGTAASGEGGGEVITPGVVFGGAAVIGAINIVLLTALCTVAAFIYNLCADLVGGLEVTLAERD